MSNEKIFLEEELKNSYNRLFNELESKLKNLKKEIEKEEAKREKLLFSFSGWDFYRVNRSKN